MPILWTFSLGQTHSWGHSSFARFPAQSYAASLPLPRHVVSPSTLAGFCFQPTPAHASLEQQLPSFGEFQIVEQQLLIP
jgi:hypothetical protein